MFLDSLLFSCTDSLAGISLENLTAQMAKTLSLPSFTQFCTESIKESKLISHRITKYLRLLDYNYSQIHNIFSISVFFFFIRGVMGKLDPPLWSDRDDE